MAFIAPVVGLLGTVASVAGSISAANAQADAANYQAQVARNNAQIANQNAEYAIRAADVEAERKGIQDAQEVAKVKAGIAASGVSVNEGSAVDVVSSEREVNKLDTLTDQHDAQLRAYGYRTQAANFEAEAGLKKLEASNARKAGVIGGVSGLLSGVGSLAGKWGGGSGS